MHRPPKSTRPIAVVNPSDGVTAALAARKWDDAERLARKLYSSQPTPAYRTLIAQVRSQAFRAHLKATNLPALRNWMKDARKDPLADPLELATIDEAEAFFGKYFTAEERPDVTIRKILLERYADGLIAVPTPPHPSLADGCTAVRSAFAAYEAGNDDAAREALQAIGLQSPYLEWKVLLRGLMAHATGDTARALESFSRLRADRMPYSLAYPLRVALDAQFRASQQVLLAEQEPLSAELSDLHLFQTLVSLEAMAEDDNPNRLLNPAITLQPQLLKNAPDLAARLGTHLYWKLLEKPSKSWITPFARTFGKPADDPEFDRAEAKGAMLGRDTETAIKAWQRYERWLSQERPGWSDDDRRYARGMVFEVIGQLEARTKISSMQDLMTQFFGLPPQPSKPDATKSEAKPLESLRQSLELAPERTQPALAYVNLARMMRDTAALRFVAQEFPKRFPDNTRLLNEAFLACTDLQLYTPALAIVERAYALNPLDSELRSEVCYYSAFAIRDLLRRRRLDEVREQVARFTPEKGFERFVPIESLRLLEEHLTNEVPIPDNLTAGLYLSIYAEAVAVKLPKATLTALKARMLEAVKTASPDELLIAADCFSPYEDPAHKFAGFTAIDKQLCNAIEAQLPLTMDDEMVACKFLEGMLRTKYLKKLKKHVAALRKKYRFSPYVMYLEGRVLTKLDDFKADPEFLDRQYTTAQHWLATKAAQYPGLAEKIAAALQEVADSEKAQNPWEEG